MSIYIAHRHKKRL